MHVYMYTCIYMYMRICMHLRGRGSVGPICSSRGFLHFFYEQVGGPGRERREIGYLTFDCGVGGACVRCIYEEACVYVYACMYVCMYVYIYIYIYIYL
jgi:hypothetical protein